MTSYDFPSHKEIGVNIQPNGAKNALDVQIHHLPKRFIRMRVELFSPRSARIRQENIHMIRRPAHFRNQSLDFCDLGAVGGDRYGHSAGSFVWERIQGLAGGFTCGCFA